MGWAGHVARMGEERRIQCMVGQHEGKRTLGSRCRWEYNFKMDIHEVGGGGMYWIKLAQDRKRCRHL